MIKVWQYLTSLCLYGVVALLLPTAIWHGLTTIYLGLWAILLLCTAGAILGEGFYAIARELWPPAEKE